MVISRQVASDVRKTCRAILRGAGWKIRSFSQNRKARTPGVGDDYGQHAGKQLRVWFEYKADAERDSRPKQAEFARDELASGGEYVTIETTNDLWVYLRAKGFLPQ